MLSPTSLCRTIYHAPRHTALIGLEHIRPKDPEVSLGMGSILATLDDAIQRGQLHPGSYKAFTYNVNVPEVDDGYPASRSVVPEFHRLTGHLDALADRGCLSFDWSKVVVDVQLWDQSIIHSMSTAVGTPHKAPPLFALASADSTASFDNRCCTSNVRGGSSASTAAAGSEVCAGSSVTTTSGSLDGKESVFELREVDTVVLGAFVWNEPYIQRLAYIFSQVMHKTVIIGGPQVTYLEPKSLSTYYPHAKGFIQGFAEQPVLRLLSGEHPTQIPGVVWRADATIEGVENVPSQPSSTTPKKLQLWNRGGMRSLPVTVLPSPVPPVIVAPGKRENLFDTAPSPILNEVVPMNQMFMRWESQRGCPYNCSFCQHRSSDSEVRNVVHASSDRIAEELKQLTEHKVQSIAVLDPTFATSGPQSEYILANLPRTAEVSFQVRPERITKTFLSNVARSPARSIVLELGVQSMVPEELHYVERVTGADHRKLPEKVRSKIAMLDDFLSQHQMLALDGDDNTHRCNIRYEISLIFGLPAQTVESFKHSLSWATECTKASKVDAFPLMLLRGTPLFYRKLELGLVEGYIRYADEPSLKHNPHKIEALEHQGHIVFRTKAPLKLDETSFSKYRVQGFIPHVVASPTMSRDDWKTMFYMALEARETKKKKTA